MSKARGLLPQSTLVVLLGASSWPDAPVFQSSKAFANSANGLRDYFVGHLGLSTENVLDLFDDDKSQDVILRKISEFLEQRIRCLEVKEGGGVSDPIVYFTGHGGFEGINSDYYLAVRQTWKKALGASSIGIKSLSQTIKDSAPFLRHIILLDACFAAAALPAFQSPIQEVVAQKIKAAFDNPLKGEGLPERGTSLLCSSSSNDPSQIAPNGEYTMFSEALLHALKNGTESASEFMSLNQIHKLVKEYLEAAYQDAAPHPEIHSPDQSEGEVAKVPLFPNPARLSHIYAQQRLRSYEPLEDRIQCCLLVSETEGRIQRGETLESVVRRTLIDYQDQILTTSGMSQLEADPYVIHASNVLSSAAAYEDVVKALCRSDIAVFDVTNYEPVVMLLLGIRSVARRGVTVASAGGDYTVGDALEFPFNIKEVNILSHSDKQLNISDPIHLIGERIIGGFSQLAQLPNYLDLPAFDAIRSLPPEAANQKNRDYTDQVLVLCSFSKEYQDNNWKRHLKRNLPIYIRSSLAKEKKPTSKEKPEVLRTLDMKSPRLVSQSLYEAIRLTDMCIVDWTEWRPNVFFELGVRISSNNLGPICIIEDKHREFIEELVQDPANAQAIKRPHSISDRDVSRLINAASQYMELLRMFDPIKYKAPTSQEQGGEDQQAYTEMIAFHKNSISTKDGKESNTIFVPNTTYNLITQWIDWKVETAARPVYKELINAANLLSNPDIDSQGMSPVLYPQNTTLIQKADEGAIERRIAAWYYLNYRYTLKDISKDPQLSKMFTDLGNIVAPALLRSSAERDNKLGELIRKQTRNLRKIRRGKTSDGHP